MVFSLGSLVLWPFFDAAAVAVQVIARVTPRIQQTQNASRQPRPGYVPQWAMSPAPTESPEPDRDEAPQSTGQRRDRELVSA